MFRPILMATVFSASLLIASAPSTSRPLGALDLDGVGSFITVSHSPDLNPAGPFTVEAWVLARSFGPELHDHIANKWDSSGGFTFSLWDGRPMFEVGTDGPNVRIDGTETLDLNGYHHVAGTWDGFEVRLFLDGALVDAAPVAVATFSASGDLVMGKRFVQSRYWWDGLFGEIRISNTCRYTENFIPPHRLVADEFSTAAWHFDELEGAIVLDETGRGNDGVVTNGNWIHSIHPVCVGGSRDGLSLSLGSMGTDHDPLIVTLLPNWMYEISVVGEVIRGPGQPLVSSMVVYGWVEGGESTTSLMDSGYVGSLPFQFADTSSVGFFLVDGDATDNSGFFQVKFEAPIPTAAPTPSLDNIEESGVLIRPNPSSRTIRLGLKGEPHARLDVDIVTVDGRRVRSYREVPGGVEWDLLDEGERSVPSGVYFARLREVGSDLWRQARVTVVE